MNKVLCAAALALVLSGCGDDHSDAPAAASSTPVISGAATDGGASTPVQTPVDTGTDTGTDTGATSGSGSTVHGATTTDGDTTPMLTLVPATQPDTGTAATDTTPMLDLVPATQPATGTDAGTETGTGTATTDSGTATTGTGTAVTDTAATNTATTDAASQTSTTGLQPVKHFQFAATANIVAPGTSTETGQCAGNVDKADIIGAVNVYSKFYQNACYTGTSYSNANYPIASGQLSSGDEHFTAYQFSAPQQSASNSQDNFVASKHYVRLKLENNQAVNLYQYDASLNKFNLLAHVDAAPDANGYTAVDALNLDDISDTMTVVVVDANAAAPSTYFQVADNVMAAQLADVAGLQSVNAYEVSLDSNITPKAVADFTAGPGDDANKYGQNHYYSVMKLSDGQVGVVWQDREKFTNYLTKFNPSSYASTTLTLPSASSHKDYLIAASTNDDNGNIYYVLFEAGNTDPNYNKNSDPHKSLSAVLIKTDESGKLLGEKELNDSQNTLNMTYFGDLHHETNVVSLKYANGKLALLYSRLHNQTADGLNHQGADGIVLDANSLTLVKSWGQFSGHSFSNVLSVADDQNFIAIDLGDNYPRGVNFHRFNASDRNSRVVYTFKTAHGTVAAHDGRGPFAPYYTDIAGQQTYQWSNDNKTYTELGGIADVDDGYAVVFASEHDAQGRVLNNAQTSFDNPSDPHNIVNARNIGFVKVSPSFEQASGSGNVVSDDLVVSHGDYAAEEGEYYSFDGNQMPQRDTGIKWLTHYDASDVGHNASRVKVAKTDANQLLVLWEEWNKTSYLQTKVALVSKDGDLVSQPATVGGVRVNRRDELLNLDNSVWSVTGDKNAHSLQFIELKLKP
ncbi:hypothetical protein [Paraferrimonas haliotis]|uniref:Uncharacterized protein n=1 Tax=Paraferrimonas haliotis TaxID=2013866 RepID=A0AA37TSI8_9GAMM|nr:hypothetical protein [Paraferrimonas haliotis]GLS83656.1 hypothetical protein GCM10007894_16330 [Paraferrimonas haliotis]